MSYEQFYIPVGPVKKAICLQHLKKQSENRIKSIQNQILKIKS